MAECSRNQGLCLYVSALLRPVKELLELGLKLTNFAVVHGDLLQDFRVLQLRL